MTASSPMRSLSADELDPVVAYRLLTSVVIPRPIGWTSTLGVEGSRNLAPFSFFNAVSNYPLTVMLSIGQRAGTDKDTLRNIRESGEFVINLVTADLAEAMNATSADWPYGADEFAQVGLTPASSAQVRPPRVAESPVAIECRLTQVVPVVDTSYTMVLGRVLCFQIREDLLSPDQTVEASRLAPLGRLSGGGYVRFGQVFDLPRPGPVS